MIDGKKLVKATGGREMTSFTRVKATPDLVVAAGDLRIVGRTTKRKKYPNDLSPAAPLLSTELRSPHLLSPLLRSDDQELGPEQ